MKKLYIFIFLFFIIINYSYWELVSCKYSSKIQECLDNQNSPRTITDFPCIQAWTGEIIFQIILDEKFKQLDKKIEDYLLNLEQKKDYYFWPNKQEPFTNGINDIEYYLWEWWEFEKEYKKLCDWGIIKEANSCFLEWIPNQLAWKFLKKDDNLQNICELTYKTSLLNYRQTAYILLKENKAQIIKDEHKKFTQKQRSKFDELLDLIMVNLWYLERLWAKWRSKTKNTYN